MNVDRLPGENEGFAVDYRSDQVFLRKPGLTTVNHYSSITYGKTSQRTIPLLVKPSTRNEVLDPNSPLQVKQEFG